VSAAVPTQSRLRNMLEHGMASAGAGAGSRRHHQTAPGGGGAGASERRGFDAAETWACAACTLENAPGTTACAVCDTARPRGSTFGGHALSPSGAAAVGHYGATAAAATAAAATADTYNAAVADPPPGVEFAFHVNDIDSSTLQSLPPWYQQEVMAQLSQDQRVQLGMPATATATEADTRAAGEAPRGAPTAGTDHGGIGSPAGKKRKVSDIRCHLSPPKKGRPGAADTAGLGGRSTHTHGKPAPRPGAARAKAGLGKWLVNTKKST